ncbi:Hsp33 family molecular chaperone HslO [Ferdinandcohnia sp. Marseille-Q9671]
MENTIVKTLIYDKQIRLYFVDNTKLINEILRMNNETSPILKNIVGKTISVASVLSGTLKGDQRMSLQLTMGDPTFKVFADTDARGNVRGYLNGDLRNTSKEYLNHVSLDRLIGNKGTIRVIKGSAMNQFTGITDMPHRNIADDISHYFNQSEQTQTYIGTHIEFGTNNCVRYSFATYAQLLPGAMLELLDEVKHKVKGNQEFLTNLNQCSENNIEEKLRELFEDVRVIGYSPVQFFCGCSKAMFYGMLNSLGEHELAQAITNRDKIDTHCQICGRTYHFDHDDIKSLL